MSHFSLERFPFEGNDNKTTTVATINGRLLNPSSTLMITNGNTTNPQLRTSVEMDGTFKIDNSHLWATKSPCNFTPTQSIYHSGPIITHSLYIFHPLFEGQKCFFKEVFFHKILSLCIVGIQVQFVIKSTL